MTCPAGETARRGAREFAQDLTSPVRASPGETLWAAQPSRISPVLCLGRQSGGGPSACQTVVARLREIQTDWALARRRPPDGWSGAAPLALTRLAFAGCSVVRHWRYRLPFGPLDGPISTRQSIDMDGRAKEQTTGTECHCKVTAPLDGRAWDSSRDDPTLLGFVAPHCGKLSRYRHLPRSLNFPLCPLADKVIWNMCKKQLRSQPACAAGAWKSSRSYDSRLAWLAGWAGPGKSNALHSAAVRFDGLDGIARCRHAVMTTNAEDFGRGRLVGAHEARPCTLLECHCIDMSQG